MSNLPTIPNYLEVCPECDGTAEVETGFTDPATGYPDTIKCGHCNGEGSVPKSCETCGRDLDEDAYGDLCHLCFIAEGEYEAADAAYDLEMEG